MCLMCNEAVEHHKLFLDLDVGPFCSEPCHDNWRKDVQGRSVPERISALEAELRRASHRESRSMGEVKRAIELVSKTAEQNRLEVAQTLTKMREPNPMTIKRAASFMFSAPGLAVLGVIGSFAIWLVSMRDTTQAAARDARDAGAAVAGVRADVKALDVAQSETAGAIRALTDGQTRVENKLDRLILGSSTRRQPPPRTTGVTP